MMSKIMATPWLILRISFPSSGSVFVLTAKWNAAGKSTAITLMVKRELLSCAAPAINPCSEYRVPPAKTIKDKR